MGYERCFPGENGRHTLEKAGSASRQSRCLTGIADYIDTWNYFPSNRRQWLKPQHTPVTRPNIDTVISTKLHPHHFPLPSEHREFIEPTIRLPKLQPHIPNQRTSKVGTKTPRSPVVECLHLRLGRTSTANTTCASHVPTVQQPLVYARISAGINVRYINSSLSLATPFSVKYLAALHRKMYSHVKTISSDT
jgi:hypothetical protein